MQSEGDELKFEVKFDSKTQALVTYNDLKIQNQNSPNFSPHYLKTLLTLMCPTLEPKAGKQDSFVLSVAHLLTCLVI